MLSENLLEFIIYPLPTKNQAFGAVFPFLIRFSHTFYKHTRFLSLFVLTLCTLYVKIYLLLKVGFMKNKLLSILYGVAIFFFIISFSIGLPIYCRFFYYLHINALNLPSLTGYDYWTIKSAYDEVLNFLTLPGAQFGTGVFGYTEAGKAHFVDCKALFDLNLIALISSTAIIGTLHILKRKKIFLPSKPFGMGVSFISAVSIFAVALVLVGLISIDFNSAFIVFHKIFFPGKDNWQFSYADEIIKVLPQEFFMNCAILIGASIVLISSGIIIYQLVKRKKSAKITPKS